MPLTIGTQLGSHEITGLLGKGGMGEVYRARDTKLKREVAIKILPEEFSTDPARVSRFEREAEVLASLNHPNIAAIYDLEESNDMRFLVLELVEGETLADRIQRGPVPAEEVLEIAKHICDAIEAAHEKGVVHRDLKPANVKITPDGRVKVLDFGLAKAIENAPESGTLSNSPTLTMGATQAGVILGTAAYMSPEQAKGFQADTRSDVFAFGSVLFEMLTGRQAFQGDTVAEILASVLVREPEFALVPANLNPRIQELLQRCLQKNPKRRWQAVGDLRAELDTVAKAPRKAAVQAEAPKSWRPLSRRLIPVLVSSIVFATIASIVTWNLKRPSPGAVIRLPYILPEGQQLTSGGSRQLAVSPDGTRLVYVANSQLFMRAMEDMEARPVAGTNNQIPSSPFFSPDGQWIGFYSREDSAFKKIPVRGGSALTIGKANGFNASWTGDQIVFASTTGRGIMRVSENGGNPEVLVSTEPGQLADNPQILDEGRILLFSLTTERGSDRLEKAQIVVQSLKTGERKVVLQGADSAHYLPTGHLVFVQGGTLFAILFDLKTLRVHGSAIPLIEGVGRTSTAISGTANFVFSDNGSLFYIRGDQYAERSVLALVDAVTGKVTPLPLPPQAYIHPRISPDGREIVFASIDNASSMVSIYDLKTGGAARRLTFEGNSSTPIWSHDGRRVAYRSIRKGDSGIFLQPFDGGTAERLSKEDGPNIEHRPEAWSPDGKTLAFTVSNNGVGDIWTLSLDGERKPKPIIELAFNQRDAVFSPNGRWLAYASSEIANRSQIFVQPFPPSGTKKYQISTEGGASPVWSPDGRHLYYQDESRLVAVEIHTDPPFGFGKPVPLPVQRYNNNVAPNTRNWDITPDGKHFLVVMPASSTSDQTSRSTQQINVVLNWVEELKQRVPVH